jgi:hypothetical protein
MANTCRKTLVCAARLAESQPVPNGERLLMPASVEVGFSQPSGTLGLELGPRAAIRHKTADGCLLRSLLQRQRHVFAAKTCETVVRPDRVVTANGERA